MPHAVTRMHEILDGRQRVDDLGAIESSRDASMGL